MSAGQGELLCCSPGASHQSRGHLPPTPTPHTFGGEEGEEEEGEEEEEMYRSQGMSSSRVRLHSLNCVLMVHRAGGGTDSSWL